MTCLIDIRIVAMRVGSLLSASSLLVVAIACSSDSLGPVAPGTFASVSGGFRYTCGLLSEGGGYCWGDNAVGQGGNGVMSTIDSAPKPVVGLVLFTQIDAGQGHTCGLVPGGAAFCWGVSQDGALGSDTTTLSAVPIPVAGGLKFKEISAGFNSTCALTIAGAAYCWGANDLGQLGRAGASAQTPVAVATNLVFTKIAVGQYYACAIAVGGDAYCWGYNQWGNLGTLDTTAHAGPRLVAGGLHFKAIDAASYQTCAITTIAAAYCWGAGQYGLLGNGSTDDHPTPALVSGNHPFAAISLGTNHSCGLDVDGRLFCWGSNGAKQLAGTTTETCRFGPLPADTWPCTSTPVAAASGRYYRGLSAGAFHTCAVEFGGGAFCWGANDRGQVGNGSTGSPVGAVTRVPDPEFPAGP
jgi:alpha-tubulin suppressor-like RCC1 family protein